MDRIWTTDTAYMGRRNPNTGLTTAWVLGSAGAEHQGEFSGTLMRGDEVVASGAFGLRLYAGHTTAPDGTGEIAELRAMADSFVDVLGPMAVDADYYPTVDRLVLTFDQAVDPVSLSAPLIGLDENADGVAELTLGFGTTVLETGPSTVLTLTLAAADAAALEALDPAALVLALGAGAVTDENGVTSDLQIAPDAPEVTVHAATLITIDGRFDAGEWDGFLALADSNDTAWGPANELDRLLVSWDDTYLYVGIDGVVEENSWLLYLDVDPGTAAGETDLTAIDAWERGASFTAPGFAADFQYGCYQHGTVWDGDSFFEITSPTTAVDRSGEIVSDHDAAHAFGDAGGSEMAIPWSLLYPGAAGTVPADAQVSLVASICWDPEPGGELGGDSVPNNTSAALPVVDAVWTIDIDANGDGEPDPWGPVAVPEIPRRMSVTAWPNPFNPVTTIRFDLPAGSSEPTVVSIVNVRGERVAELVNQVLPAGRHTATWRGRDRHGHSVSAGTYYCVVRSGDHRVVRPLTLVK